MFECFWWCWWQRWSVNPLFFSRELQNGLEWLSAVSAAKSRHLIPTLFALRKMRSNDQNYEFKNENLRWKTLWKMRTKVTMRRMLSTLWVTLCIVDRALLLSLEHWAVYSSLVSLLVLLQPPLREHLPRKRMFSFGHCPNVLAIVHKISHKFLLKSKNICCVFTITAVCKT